MLHKAIDSLPSMEFIHWLEGISKNYPKERKVSDEYYTVKVYPAAKVLTVVAQITNYLYLSVLLTALVGSTIMAGLRSRSIGF